MKLSFSTLPCATWSLEKTLQICKENCIDAIEMRMGLNEWSDLNMSDEKVDHMLQLLNQYGIVISDLGTQVITRDYNEEKLKDIKTCAKMANKLKTQGLRIMLGNFRTRKSEQKLAPDYDGIIRWLKEACSIVGEYGTEIWIETHNEFSTGKVLRQVLDDVKRENCKIVWDIIHPVEFEESVEETMKYMGRDIAHIHIKDGIPWEDKDLESWKYTRLGEGIIPVEQILYRMETQGYKGYYSLEWESAWRAEIRGEGYEGEVVIPHFAQYMRELKAKNDNK